MISVTKIIPGGQGLGTTPEGKKIFFWNALPGESVTDYIVTKSKSHYLEAIATSIDNPSPYRVAPLDECYLSTSPWQMVDYAYELKSKQELVVEMFREHQIAIDIPPILTDNNDYHYRNKMEYSLYWNHATEQIQLAFHQRGSHRKLPITQSSIERPELFAQATEIVDELNRNHDEARKYQSLLLRCNQAGRVSGGLYENHQPHPVFPHLTDTILGHEYSYSPNGFFQINLPVYEMALKEIRQHITTGDVLDLYAGVGTIGLSVARDHHLTLVECDKFAFNELCVNSAQITQFETVCDNGSKIASEPLGRGHERSGSRNESLSKSCAILAKSEEMLEYIIRNQIVILDPPRSGCDRKLIDKLNEVGPAKVIYLSCNPATQARDVKMLLDHYYISNITTFNFFPHTPHIENLLILAKK